MRGFRVLNYWHSVWKRFKITRLSEIIQHDKSNVIASEPRRARKSRSSFCGLLRHFIPRNDNKVVAFTLAEVLITLVIIGVIAALTIPNLIAKHQEHAFKVAWKKNFQVLSQIAGRANADGVQLYKSSSEFDGRSGYLTTEYLQNTLKPYYKNAQSGIFWYCNNVGPKNALKWYSKDGYRGSNSYCSYGLKLEDGTELAFDPGGEVFFDVNGAKKKPNIVGKDIFAAIITEDNRVYPAGIENITKSIPAYSCNSDYCGNGKPMKQDCESGKGWGCSALYILEE